jgi:hypothetical protein
MDHEEVGCYWDENAEVWTDLLPARQGEKTGNHTKLIEASAFQRG